MTRTSGETMTPSDAELLEQFETWLRTVCFQKPTPEAYDLALCAWKAAMSTRRLSPSEGLRQVREKVEKRRDEFFHEHGYRESDTNATGYSDWGDARYEEGLSDAIEIIDEALTKAGQT